MSEEQSLISNLNEIMEEYVGNEEEVTPELQIMVIDLRHDRVSGINKICFLYSSYYRSQATAA